MTADKNKDSLIDELGDLKYQLDGGPEYQPFIPGLELPGVAPPTELEALMDELEQQHLTRLESRVRSNVSGCE